MPQNEPDGSHLSVAAAFCQLSRSTQALCFRFKPVPLNLYYPVLAKKRRAYGLNPDR